MTPDRRETPLEREAPRAYPNHERAAAVHRPALGDGAWSALNGLVIVDGGCGRPWVEIPDD